MNSISKEIVSFILFTSVILLAFQNCSGKFSSTINQSEAPDPITPLEITPEEANEMGIFEFVYIGNQDENAIIIPLAASFELATVVDFTHLSSENLYMILNTGTENTQVDSCHLYVRNEVNDCLEFLNEEINITNAMTDNFGQPIHIKIVMGGSEYHAQFLINEEEVAN